ncbi:MAG TPA: nuclear transport factor 2 family protein [Dyella sp.]|nr:nuclear transport factor 2 family protein [Dyella sp.]
MRHLIDRYIDAYNRIDVDAMLLTLHPGIVFENISGGTLNVRTQGIAEFERLARSTQPLFSARRQIITAYSEAGDTATAHILFDGTFAMDLPNGVRAGQGISMPGRSEFRIHDGLLIYIADHSE